KEELDDENVDSEYTPSDTTFQFKVELEGVSDPTVWRRLTLPSNYTFFDFHNSIQIAFGWDDSHLFMFSPKGFGSNPQITELMEDDMNEWGDEKLDVHEIILSEIFNTEKQKYTYIYDFGDSWKHSITLEKIVPKTTPYPDCVDGNGKCPPEDCGGIGGYYALMEILADKKHPEYEENAEWMGLEDDELWDPNEFNIEEIKSDLKEIFEEDSI
ncbi:MAG TPA: plasmid pRiA4b ORF-3 family protein, partial [Draconibacterium sp.]|nr:plasmid pRiA4b ORF-3 family protein [Draconibacterium sp.]